MLAEQIGAAIAAQGWAVMTGGYGGLMEVTSRAAAAGRGHGHRPAHARLDRPDPNRWNYELRWSDTYPERLAHLLAADALIALDGGIGTLSEAAAAWSALQTEPAAAELIFLGAGWPPVLRALADHLVIDARDLAYATVCADPDDAIAHIAKARPGQPRAAAPRG